MKRKTTQRGNIGLHRSLLPAPAPPSCSLLLPTSCFLHPYSYLNTHVTFWLYSFDLTLEIFRVLYSFVSIVSIVWYKRLLFLFFINFAKTPVTLSTDVWCEGVVSIVIQFRENTWAIGCISSVIDHMVLKRQKKEIS